MVMIHIYGVRHLLLIVEVWGYRQGLTAYIRFLEPMVQGLELDGKMMPTAKTHCAYTYKQVCDRLVRR